MKVLDGKVAVVTGASKGIGAAIAASLAEAGASVVVNYSASKEAADSVVKTIVGAGGKAVAVQADVASESDVQRLFETTRSTFGRLDVLVNNAGIYKFDPIEAVTAAEFHSKFNTNVLGPLLTIREGLKLFGPRGGSIINISSIVASNPYPGTSVYSATKSALDQITRVLARELGPKKIRVNGIAPGGTETEGLHAAGLAGGDFEKSMVANTPLGRLGQPPDIARVAVFLASDDSGWVTGENIAVSGGQR